MTDFQDKKDAWVKVDGVNHLVGPNHIGMTCHICNEAQSGHKIYEDSDEAVILYDNNGKLIELSRHPWTAYVCCACFSRIMGPIVQCGGLRP